MSYLNVTDLNSVENKKFQPGTGERRVVNIEPSLVGISCLVLDDEFLIALDIQHILENAGAASILCVGNAADALAALRDETRFDLAVLDVKLSGATPTSMSIAALLIEQRTPFVFLTGTHRHDLHAKEYPNVPVI